MRCRMKKIAMLLAGIGVLCAGNRSGYGGTISIRGGGDPVVRVEDVRSDGLRLRVDLPSFESESVQAAGRAFQRLHFEGYGSWGEPGKPELPVISRLVLLPDRADWRWEVVEAESIELENYDIAPLQPETIESPASPVVPEPVYDEASYRQDEWLPSEAVALGKPVISRGYRLGRLEIHPLQYNPLRRVLRVYHRLTIDLTFSGEGENPVQRATVPKSRVFSRMIMSSVVNPRPLLDEDTVLGGYLFITPPNLENTLQTRLVDWKKEKGFPCTVMTTTQAGGTAAAIKSTIQNLYNTAEVPPDYLVLVGDEDYGMPTFFYTNPSAYNEQCGTDLPYTLLEGDDYFPDLLAGRLSVDSDNELMIVCNKIRGYERDPYMTNQSWFTQGLMVYDYDGSESCRTTKERCAQLMLQNGYTTVSQVTNPPTYSGATPINNAINAGVTFVNYRGYGSYSSWTPPNYSSSNINSLTNGYMLPVITSIVCGGGCFTVSTDPCFGEAWLRYGTATTPKGAVSFIGPSSLHTHTRWNNCIDGGIYQGIFAEGIPDLGSALLRGKMELYNNMPYNLGPGGTTNSVECYFHIYNILGDPGLALWTGVPTQLTVTCPTELPQGVNAFNITVTASGAPVQDALVCIYNAVIGVQKTAWTNADGGAVIDLGNLSSGYYAITVTGQNLKPYHATLTVSQQSVALGMDSYTLDDDMIGESSGDGDGQFNPGETVELLVTLRNTGSTVTATGISGTITSADPYLTIAQGTLTGPDAAPGAVSPLNDDFNLVLSSEAPHSHIVPILLNAACAQGSWSNIIQLPVVAPLAEIVQYIVMNPGNLLNPGQSANVNFTLMNSGGDPLINCNGSLTSPNPLLTVTDAFGSWGTINAGASAANVGNPFTMQASGSCPPGTTVLLQLIVTANGYADTILVNFTVGQVSLVDPTGPDGYGYRCYENRDGQYAQAPTYSWIEASTQPGHVQLNLPDYGNEQDCSVLQALPFPFRYYGWNYNQMTICSNGWIAMGAAYMTGTQSSTLFDNARNWNIPAALGPSAMIAPFWDDLQMGSGSVHYWYNSAEHFVVVEWKQVRTAGGWGENTFEAILYDPAYHFTPTGDGEIVFQYALFNNVDADENYCTIGIENPQQSDGVKVTYANYYSAGAGPITAGTALKFSTGFDFTPLVPNVVITLTPYGAPILIPISGGSFTFDVSLENEETTPLAVSAWIDVTLPNGSLYGPVLGPVNLTLPVGVPILRQRTQTVPGSAPAGVYHYNAYVGSYPATIWDSTSFAFSKLTDGYERWEAFWKNDGESFTDCVGSEEGETPHRFFLHSARPNPFNPETRILFELAEAAPVDVGIFDLRGRRVAVLAHAMFDAGVHELIWGASDFPSGIYFCLLRAGDFRAAQKLVLLK